MTPSLESLAQRCDGAHRDKQGWRAKCPVHQGQSDTSLHLWEEHGTLQVHCFAGCQAHDIMAWLGVSRAQERGERYDALYSYHDERGHVLYQVVRLPGKKFFQRRPDPVTPGKWIKNLKGVMRVLYRLPEVLQAVTMHQPVYVVEGEKDVETLRGHGLVATCNVGGAGKWDDGYNASLKGAQVIVLPDHDEPGARHATLIAIRLRGVVRSLHIVPLPHLPEHGDVTDWLQAGHTVDELRQIVQHTAATLEETGPAAASTRRPHVVHMDQVEAAPLAWLWWPYIARGTLTMLDGDPGIGKSLFTLYLGAIVSNGHPLPDQQGQPTLPTGDPGIVVLLSAEDSVTHTIKQRLTDSNANQRHIKVVTSYFDAQGEEQFLTLDADHRPLLEQVLQEYHPALVIIDPLQAFLGKMDMHRANETRPFMRGLSQLAETYQTSIVCVRHPAKPGQTVGKAIHRGMGSVDFIGATRSGLFVEQHPTDKDKVLLCHIKHNLSLEGRTQIFSKHEGQFHWERMTRLSAETIAGQGRGPHPYAFLEACFWLEDQFRHTTTQGSKDLEDKADEAEINWRLLKDAKKALGITSEKLGKKSWLWKMPALPVIPPPFSLSTTPTTHTTPTSPTSPSSDGSRASGTGEAREEGGETRQGEQGEQGEEGEAGEEGEVDVVVYQEEDDVPPPGRMRWARPAQDERPRGGQDG